MKFFRAVFYPFGCSDKTVSRVKYKHDQSPRAIQKSNPRAIEKQTTLIRIEKNVDNNCYDTAFEENAMAELRNNLELEALFEALDNLEKTESPPKSPSVWKDLLLLFIKIASIIMAFVLLFTLVFGVIRYQEPSMAPAIKDGDLVIFHRYTKSGYMPQDAVALMFNGKKQIRRVVATAGDSVDITEDGLVVNGALQQESDIFQKTERYAEGVSFPLTVPEGEIFVLGDSRIGASDSRIYGCVRIEDTLGKVMTVIRRRSI